MKFGPETTTNAVGGILAHSVQVGTKKLKKGRVLSVEDCDLFQQQGIDKITVARLSEDDVGEDQAADQLASVLCSAEIYSSAAFTGRANLYAQQPGILQIDTDALNQFNLIHEDITLASLAPFSVVQAKQMLATIKIIPFGVHKSHIHDVLAIAQNAPLLRINVFSRTHIGLIQTLMPGLKDSVLDKTTQVVRQRLTHMQATLLGERRCRHEQSALAAAIHEFLSDGCEIILIVGASAIVDRRDVIPSAIQQAGGRIEHYGMPVDPGNLLLLGYCGTTPVLGLPGCARSPKPNGFDTVLERLCAGIDVNGRDIMLLGAGGLLKELPSRPQPRNQEGVPAPARAPRIAGLVLAAGQSRRMGEQNKLLLDIQNRPMVQHIVSELNASQVCGIWVVTGHQAEQVEQALAASPVQFVHNPAYAEGLSASLKAGLAALPDDIDGVLVCLGDMPDIKQPLINQLIAAFDPLEGRAICVPTHQGKRGNPVLWSKRFIPEMMDLAGDSGAKHLLGEYSDSVCELETRDKAVLLDLDSPEALAAYRA